MARYGVKLYIDLMSQPCRAVALTSKLLGIRYSTHQVIVSKGGTRSPALLSVNADGRIPVAEFFDAADGAPAGTLPSAHDSSTSGALVPFVLTESTAIMRYLCDTSEAAVAERLYPHDKRHRARVNSKLDWYHSSLRQGAHNWVFHSSIAPRIGVAPQPGLALAGEKMAVRSFDTMQSWLAKQAFLAGSSLTLADLSALCELHQLRLLKAQAWTDRSVRAAYPAIYDWQMRCTEELQPHLSEVNVWLDRAVAALEFSGPGGQPGEDAGRTKHSNISS